MGKFSDREGKFKVKVEGLKEVAEKATDISDLANIKRMIDEGD